jgi:ABC-type polysaccharide/polyol phosphate export permease
MRNNVYLAPSFYAHMLNAFVMIFAIGILYVHFAVFKKMDPYRLIMLALLFSIVFGIHALSHLGLEKVYNFNPLASVFTTPRCNRRWRKYRAY